MAKSRYEYTRLIEKDDYCQPNKYIVVRIDGISFHRFTTVHNYNKPNDIYGLQCMNYAALYVSRHVSDIILSYGISDEYSFIIQPYTTYYQRRKNKIISVIVSLFTAQFNLLFTHITKRKLQYPATFDGRIVEYNIDELRDYLSYRQVDLHINQTYNYLYHTLCMNNMTNTEAEKICSSLDNKGKLDMLKNKYNIDYNNVPLIYRYGSIICWLYYDNNNDIYNNKKQKINQLIQSNDNNNSSIQINEQPREKRQLVVLHESMFENDTNRDVDFFVQYPYIIPYISHNQRIKLLNKQKKELYKQGILQPKKEKQQQKQESDNVTDNNVHNNNNDDNINDGYDEIVTTSNGHQNYVDTSKYIFNETDDQIQQIDNNILQLFNNNNNTNNTSTTQLTRYNDYNQTLSLQQLNWDTTQQHIYFVGENINLDIINVNELLVDQYCGAVSSFAGYVRQNDINDINQVDYLYYECYDRLVRRQLCNLLNKCIKVYNSIHRIIYIHKLGRVNVGEISILIGCNSPHRRDSLNTVEYLIENTKKYLSIFKKEVFVDNTGHWNTNKEYDKFKVLDNSKIMDK